MARVECGGAAFAEFEARRLGLLKDDDDDDEKSGNENTGSATTTTTNDDNNKKKSSVINLLSISSEELEELTYYDVLGDLALHATAEQVKKAYHKACLKYHPDKTGRGEEDEVFLKVKAAFDALSDKTKRKAYDSSMPFDESIPKGNEDQKLFYKTYGPVFERNLRFDARLDPDKKPSTGGKKNKNKKHKKQGPPPFGDDDTQVEQVHQFYDYWIHFESWRDFSVQAAKLTNNENFDADNVDSRYEKRYIQKEIEKKAKALKRDEMSRINTMVERAMAADPRLKREKQRQQDEKERIAKEKKEKEEAARKAKAEEEERLAKETAEREAREKEEKAAAKAIKEKEKKQLRKSRQSFRKLMLAAHSSSSCGMDHWDSMESMNDDVEFLCEHLTALELDGLTSSLGGAQTPDPKPEGIEAVQHELLRVKEGKSKEEAEAEMRKQQARKDEERKAKEAKAARAPKPWSKEELSALAKGVKKFPPGGANRWDTIALFVNNLCRPDDPRTKEECIATYNKIASGKMPGTNGSAASNSKEDDNPAAESPTSSTTNGDGWSDEQSKKLKAALAKYPASMDKNERWSSIAKEVKGKSKKECVQQFKRIREALKNKK